MWDLIVSVPYHCLSFYFPFFSQETIYDVRTELRQSLALLSTVMLDN